MMESTSISGLLNKIRTACQTGAMVIGTLGLLFAQPFGFCQSPGQLESQKIVPSYFVSNLQTESRIIDNPEVLAFIQTKQGRVLFTEKGAFMGIEARADSTQSSAKRSNPDGLGGIRQKTIVLQSGTNQKVSPELVQKTEARVNFLVGPKENWKTNLPVFQKLLYEEAWPGIDLEYLGYMDRLEYRLTLAPGADSSLIRMETGANTIVQQPSGALRATTDMAHLNISAPFAFQNIDGKRIPVDVSFVIKDKGGYGFKLGKYDSNYSLTIDPTLTWGSYLGGDGSQTGEDRGNAIQVSNIGMSYVAGTTNSSNFPTKSGAFDTTDNGKKDAYVLCMYSNGYGLRFATFIGGSDDDEGKDLVLENNTNICVVGNTYSSDFPVTQNAYDLTFNGGRDIFVLKLNADGSALNFSTFVGSSGMDEGLAVVLDSNRDVLVSGSTFSSNFPVINAYDSTQNGSSDMVAFKLAADGSTMIYSTFIGGSLADTGTGIALSPSGGVYLCGTSKSTNFPIVTGAPQTAHSGGSDAVIVQLDAQGNRLVSSTYLGGTADDYSFDIVSDSFGNVSICGTTYSSDFPTTTGVLDSTFSGLSEGFVAKLNNDLANWDYVTYLGGTETEDLYSITLNSLNEAIVTGKSTSSNFPVTPGAYNTSFSGIVDAVIAHLNLDGSALHFGTYVGGKNDEQGRGVALGPNEEVYVTGTTASGDFPTTAGVMSPSYQGGLTDAYVLKLKPDGSGLLFSTFVGGGSLDTGEDIALDSDGNVYICGSTGSGSFPTVSGSFDSTYNGKELDAFLTKFASNGSSLMYSTYIGGNSVETAMAVTVDSTGRAILAGSTYSSDFPVTSGAFDETNNGGSDVFLLRLNNTGSHLEYSTLIGSFGLETANDVVVDANGNAFLTGSTTSQNFPTSSAYDSTYNNQTDCFVLEMNQTGTALVFSTFLGGTGEDIGTGIALGTDSSIFVTGTTSSTDFPTQSAYDATHNGWEDIFITKLDRFGSSLVFSSYLGGTNQDFSTGIVINSSNEAIVTGYSNSTNFPMVVSYASRPAGGYDAILAKLSNSGSSLAFSSYFGGTQDDKSYGIVADSSGEMFITGETKSLDLPVTPGAFDETPNGDKDIFISKFSLGNPRLQLLYSTYIGGSGADWATGIAYAGTLIAGDEVVISGATQSIDFPVTSGTPGMALNGEQDAVIARLTTCSYPLQPDPIVGETVVCQNQTGVTYSVPPVTNAWSYNWTVPSGAVITSESANQITVTFGTTSGNIEVSGTGSCGTGQSRVLSVQVLKAPDKPGTINGNSTVCASESGVSYSIDPVTDADDYQWAVPLDATIISGQGTTDITVDFGTSGGRVSVTAGNSCGISSIQALDITMNSVPGQPNPISGPTEFCVNQSGVSYSIDPVPNTTGYIWGLPPGAFITSGEGTPNITVQFGSSEGYVVVVPTNECGQGFSRNLFVTKSTPISILQHPTSQTKCEGDTVTFSVVASGTTPMGFQWSFNGTPLADQPGISGATTQTLQIQNLDPTQAGPYSCTVTNYCGSHTSLSAQLTVSALPDQPGPISGPIELCKGTVGVSYSISAVPGATGYNWTVPAGSSIASGQGTSSITVNFGMDAGDITVKAENACGIGPSRTMAIGLDPTLAITSQPISQEICPGGSVQFSVQVTGENASYQWTLDGIDLIDGASISGANTETLSITDLGLENEGAYRCAVTNLCESISTTDAFLTVDGPLKATLESPGLAMGLELPWFRAQTECAVPIVQNGWTVDPGVTYSQTGDTITFLELPTTPITLVSVLVEDGLNRGQSILLSVPFLTSSSPLFYDYNQDSCNNMQDLWDFSQEWRSVYNGDPNGDNFIDIRDFLFINTSGQGTCN